MTWLIGRLHAGPKKSQLCHCSDTKNYVTCKDRYFSNTPIYRKFYLILYVLGIQVGRKNV
jgi:hypothetical protein